MDSEKITEPRLMMTGEDSRDSDGPKEIENILEIPEVDTKKTLRKMDLRLLPILTVLYLFAFLDRGYDICRGQAPVVLIFSQEYRQCKDSWHDHRIGHERSPVQHRTHGSETPVPMMVYCC